jgi:hypothetical protein
MYVLVWQTQELPTSVEFNDARHDKQLFDTVMQVAQGLTQA